MRWVQQVLSLDPPEDPDLRAALDLLKQWKGSGNQDSTGIALVMLARELEQAPKADPLQQLDTAVRYLLEKYGRLDVPWEEVLRLRRGDLDLGLGGCPDCLRAVDIRLQDDGRLVGINGDCFFQMVEWGADGTLRSESIHQYGSAASDPDSPITPTRRPSSLLNTCGPPCIMKKILTNAYGVA